MRVQHNARLAERTVQRMAFEGEEMIFRPYRKNGGKSRNNTSRVKSIMPANEVMAAARSLIGVNGYTRTITKSETEVWVI